MFADVRDWRRSRTLTSLRVALRFPRRAALKIMPERAVVSEEKSENFFGEIV